jgi:predicted nucleotide-binding protein
VLELGYFIGRLGRGNVAVISHEDDSGPVERPGDVDGVVYIPYKDDWRTKLLREFRAAEIKHDASKA